MAAFDTENKRRSALNTSIYRNLPIADGTIGLDDRAMLLFQYAHDSFPALIPAFWLSQNSAYGDWSEKQGVSGDWLEQEEV